MGEGAEQLKRHFLDHQRLWGTLILLAWSTLNVMVLTTTVLMEAQTRGSPLPFWEPFCWEATSTLMIVVLIFGLLLFAPRYIEPRPWWQQALIHLSLIVPFSLLHVLGMMLLRKAWYWAVGSDYQMFDNTVLMVFVYEFRKDFMSYLLIIFVIQGYKMMVLRLRGEASYVHVGDTEPQVFQPPQQLLVKKLGKEFLIRTADIAWVEASGNYANLHVADAVYPMRITMARLETLLPAPAFLRIHRSYIVNAEQIAHIEPQESGDYKLTLKNARQLNFSRRYRESFRDIMTANHVVSG